MRGRIYFRISRYFIILSFLWLLLGMFTIILQPVSAQEQGRLIIVLYEHDPDTGIPMEDYIFLEGKKYVVSVGYEKINESGVVERGIAYNVTITVPWGTYVNSILQPEISIIAPSFESYPSFLITASKKGYVADEVEVTVIKGRIRIFTDPSPLKVKEKEGFLVTVKDQDGNRIAGAMVYIDQEGYRNHLVPTNEDGIAYLSAPTVKTDEEITVTAYKEGYTVGSTTIFVENIEDTSVIPPDFLSILAAFLFVILAIIFVRLRGKIKISKTKNKIRTPLSWGRYIGYKKNLPLSEYKTSDDENKPASETKHAEEKKTVEVRGPKIEEIRIYRTDKKRETKYVSDEDKRKSISSRRKYTKPQYDWFEGTEDIRYKIDRITGKIDEEEIDKWFEGVDDIRSKIDETLRKKYKNKK